MTALEKKPVTMKDVGLVQGLLVVAAQLKKYCEMASTRTVCADPRRFNLSCLAAELTLNEPTPNASDPTADPSAARPPTRISTTYHTTVKVVSQDRLYLAFLAISCAGFSSLAARVRRARVADRRSASTAIKVRHHVGSAGRRREG